MSAGVAALSFARLRAVPPRLTVITAVASAFAVVLGIIQGWPAWAAVGAALAPWVPLLGFEIGWTRRHYGWLALYYVLVITQGGHVIEHIVQVTQIHVFDVAAPNARGVFGALDIEWVHFVWNTWVFLAVVLLLLRFRRNPWLWASLAFAAWHQAEHTYLIARYIATGLPGNPGLAAMGGVLADGLPVGRPDLHFFYNIIETTPLVVGFLYQLRRTYDSWLARAFPRLEMNVLSQVTSRAQSRRFASGQEIIREGDFPRSCYVVTRGEVEVLHGRTPSRVALLGPGQIFGEIGLLADTPRTATVRALTAAEVLELDGSTFRDIVDSSPQTAESLRQVAGERSDS